MSAAPSASSTRKYFSPTVVSAHSDGQPPKEKEEGGGGGQQQPASAINPNRIDGGERVCQAEIDMMYYCILRLPMMISIMLRNMSKQIAARDRTIIDVMPLPANIYDAESDKVLQERMELVATSLNLKEGQKTAVWSTGRFLEKVINTSTFKLRLHREEQETLRVIYELARLNQYIQFHCDIAFAEATKELETEMWKTAKKTVDEMHKVDEENPAETTAAAASAPTATTTDEAPSASEKMKQGFDKWGDLRGKLYKRMMRRIHKCSWFDKPQRTSEEAEGGEEERIDGNDEHAPKTLKDIAKLMLDEYESQRINSVLAPPVPILASLYAAHYFLASYLLRNIMDIKADPQQVLLFTPVPPIDPAHLASPVPTNEQRIELLHKIHDFKYHRRCMSFIRTCIVPLSDERYNDLSTVFARQNIDYKRIDHVNPWFFTILGSKGEYIDRTEQSPEDVMFWFAKCLLSTRICFDIVVPGILPSIFELPIVSGVQTLENALYSFDIHAIEKLVLASMGNDKEKADVVPLMAQPSDDGDDDDDLRIKQEAGLSTFDITTSAPMDYEANKSGKQ